MLITLRFSAALALLQAGFGLLELSTELSNFKEAAYEGPAAVSTAL